MTNWPSVINQIEGIIDRTKWNDINSPEQVIKLVEAKACLLNAVKKIEKVVENDKR